ncbi:MAG: efflux RND transporter permease subunit [Gemmatimonadales bacterium]|nr:efflux RND transporter permease subunit [Gemmatimonadales bacterium]MBT3498997.1 efflux RND transporter permease subunit [Gemmatimonadales bacterium]MBT3774392.1 efflux RND transporter permease subunit [Gemmatimonadales bacterium]MBT3957772.1 efflux RND transporter permease subunit [Gemmatimonadales bacterium]MBT4187477.1 efflux RND transporter permease subunit [Gemmatimonadales bacterium]
MHDSNEHVAQETAVDEALAMAGQTPFQPIVLTTMTTSGGLVPLALTGSEMWSPLALAIIGGLLTSTTADPGPGTRALPDGGGAHGEGRQRRR